MYPRLAPQTQAKRQISGTISTLEPQWPLLITPSPPVLHTHHFVSQPFILSIIPALAPLSSATCTHQKKVSILSIMVSMRLDINTPDARGRSPAHAAAVNNNIGALLELAEPSFQAPPPTAALSHSVSSGNGGGSGNTTRALDVDARDEDGTTALHLAAAAGHVEAVDLLCSAGADINACDGTGQTCVWRAVVDGKVCAEVLL